MRPSDWRTLIAPSPALPRSTGGGRAEGSLESESTCPAPRRFFRRGFRFRNCFRRSLSRSAGKIRGFLRGFHLWSVLLRDGGSNAASADALAFQQIPERLQGGVGVAVEGAAADAPEAPAAAFELA